MRIAKNGALFFGLKIGRRSTDLVVCDFLGQIIAQTRSTYNYPTPDGAVRFATKGVEQLSEQLPIGQRLRIVGLGIAFPSYLWEWTNIVGAPSKRMSDWRERDISREIGACLGIPVFCQNDASCACGAELVFGTQDRPANFLHIFVGYFVGGGVVLDNRLIVGPTGNAGALGPMPIPVHGNNKGQLVEVASLAGLDDMVQKSGGDSSAIWERPSAWNFDRKTTQKWLKQAAEGLAHAIVSACSVFDFELVLVDGWLPQEIRRELVDLIEQSIATFNLTGLVRPIIREGSVGPDARSIGAATLPLSARFLISQGAFSTGGHNLLSVERFRSQIS
ncbi:MAG: ROK family protein [Rhizobiaceae bacterium]